MRVRTFTAATMPDAMAMVRAEMGEDAVILSSHRGKRGVEVKAAAEKRPALDLEDVDAAYSRLAALEAEFERRLIAAVAEPRTGPSQTAPELWTDETVVARLMFHEMPRPLIERLCATAAKLSETPGPTALAQAFDAHLAFRPLSAELEKPVALVGPPGAGKTACAAKLAVRAVLAGRSAVLVSTDTSAGAASQIDAFAELIRLPVVAGVTPDALADALAKLKSDDANRAVIIDTPGVNPFDRAESAQLRITLEASGAEPVLVTPAHGGGDLEDHALMFKALGAERMIVTRLDIARRLGGLVAAASASGLAFAQGSASPYIAETLEPMNPFALARHLLTGAAEPVLPGARG
ncbi:MAG: GTPase [Alphaproteobacteria bacterium]|nr:GTPase [Alphaproteobacteria bacterium]